jgi:hypothetical protein
MWCTLRISIIAAVSCESASRGRIFALSSSLRSLRHFFGLYRGSRCKHRIFRCKHRILRCIEGIGACPKLGSSIFIFTALS